VNDQPPLHPGFGLDDLVLTMIATKFLRRGFSVAERMSDTDSGCKGRRSAEMISSMLLRCTATDCSCKKS
jgi:hypothetical protein